MLNLFHSLGDERIQLAKSAACHSIPFRRCAPNSA
jgi:hypothetical protein